MADVMPDYNYEIQKLKVQLKGLEHNMEKYKLELIEMEGRKIKALDNIEATERAMRETQETLDGLVKTHGKEPEDG